MRYKQGWGITMFGENKKKTDILFVIAFLAIGIGSIAGSVYYSYCYKGSEDVENYLNDYIVGLKSGMDFYSVVKSSAKSYIFSSLVIAAASFLKLGPFVTLGFLIRKGFVNSFTSAAFFDLYGLKGLAFLLSSAPQILILIPSYALLFSVCTIFSRYRRDFEKKDKIIYIIFLTIITAIFCICAVLEGFTTTTFMKWIAMKVT